MPEITHQEQQPRPLPQAYYLGLPVETENYHMVGSVYCCTIVMPDGTKWDNVPVSLVVTDLGEK